MVEPRDNIARLSAYTPGEQPTWRDTARPARPVVKLNTNENPYPPSDTVMRAIADLPAEALRLYPPPLADRFRAAAGRALGLDADRVIATNGGDELLRLAIATYCDPGGGPGGIGVLEPTYSLYPVLAKTHGASITACPRNPETFALDPVKTAGAWNAAACRVGFVVNPHAPSGRWETLETITALAEAFDGLLVVDEAYVDFAPGDAVGLVRQRDDVLLLRSLSKGYSLAGLRFGYGVADPSVIAVLDKARDSYNTDILAQAAATAAIESLDHAQQSWEAVRRERARLSEALSSAGWRVWPSETNFLLTRPPAAPHLSAEAVYRELKQRDILVRHFSAPGLADKLRITVGTPEQDDALLAVLRDLADGSTSR